MPSDGARGYSDELELLDILNGSDTRLLEIEKFAFGADREKALRSISLMQQEGLISVTRHGTPIEKWQSEHWRRQTDSETTERDLANVLVALP
jgi:hypothetical protein